MFELTAQTAVRLVAAKTPEQKMLAFRDLVLKIHEKRLLLRQYSSSFLHKKWREHMILIQL
jgi:hypothetical protein